MAKATPQVRDKQLFIGDAKRPICLLDSVDWSAWLETATAFRYFATGRMKVSQSYSRPLTPISVRKEKRRQGTLWYAYRRVNGQLYKRYVGKSEALTITRLDEVATDLNRVW